MNHEFSADLAGGAGHEHAAWRGGRAFRGNVR
jgi:hypothetical protein